jgi:hypothetical protein
MSMSLGIGLGLAHLRGRRAGTFTPASLFTQGEAGTWLEARTGALTAFDTYVEATATDGTVGFLTDLSQGAGYDGGLTSPETPGAPSSWTNDGFGTLTDEGDGFTAVNTSGNREIAYSDAFMSGDQGQFFVVSFNAVQISATNDDFGLSSLLGNGRGAVLDIGTTGAKVALLQSAFANGPYGVRFRGQDVGTLEIDDIQITPLPGNHASQATSDARPALRESGGVYYLEADGVDDALTWSAPADDYTVAWVNSAGEVTIQTAQALDGATDIMQETTIVAYVAVNRALTAAETVSLTAYLED